MKIRLNENIKALRRTSGYTQQQLADAMGVTVGAVSKWESGQSSPDILLLAELADFFEVSVDVLLGYQWKKTTMGATCEEIKRYTREKNVADGSSTARKAVQKYPNSFEIVYYSAKFFRLNGMEKGDRTLVKEALELYRRALLLVDRSEDETITVTSINNSIADTYILLGETDTAVEYLKKNNPDGYNNGIIGFILSQTNKEEEAHKFLSESLINTYAEMFRTCIGLANCFAGMKNYNEAVEAFNWLLSMSKGLKKPGVMCYIDKMDVMIKVGLANLKIETGRREEAEKELREALHTALLFDANPDCGVNNIRFTCESDRVLFDDFGPTAFMGIEKSMLAADNAELAEMWERIKNEER